MIQSTSANASLVTGANRGIGNALLTRLATRGPAIGTTRGPAPDSPAVRWETLDVTDPASQKAMAERLEGVPIGLLVCNAGIYPDKGQPLETGYPAEMWAEMFATNVTGVFLTVQALLPNLRAASNARIAIIASQMGSSERAPGGSYIYRASKAAAINLGRNLAVDLAPQGISIGIYHPGWVQTDMGGQAADITSDAAADALIARFDEIGPENTGRFATWDGRDHPF